MVVVGEVTGVVVGDEMILVVGIPVLNPPVMVVWEAMKPSELGSLGSWKPGGAPVGVGEHQ